MPDVPIQNTIEGQLKDAYTTRRRRFQPGYLPNDLRNEKDWGLAAQMVRKLDADPERFMEAQFSATAMDQPKFPYPNMLYSEKAAANYAKFSIVALPKPEAMLEVENRLLASWLDGDLEQKKIDLILAKPNLPFKSWYRILMVSDECLSIFWDVWGPTAIQQMQRVPHLWNYLKNSNYRSRANRFDYLEASAKNPHPHPQLPVLAGPNAQDQATGN